MPETCGYTNPETTIGCRMPVANGQHLCGSHGPSSVVCPKCGTRLPQSRLAHHLSKPLCPVRKRLLALTNTPFYKHNINLQYPPSDTPPLTPTVPIITALLSRLPTPTVATQHIPHLPEHPPITTAWSNQSDHTLKMEAKHFTQIASLSSLLLTPPPTKPTQIIEIAAGRAYTSLYLAHALTLRAHETAIIAIDRAATRLKADRTLRAWQNHPSKSLRTFLRLRLDLAHLAIENLPITTTDVRIVAKHACGVALDLALTAATNFARASPASVSLVLASCCRNRCEFRAFGDGGRVWADWGVSNEQLAHVCKAAQWPFDRSKGEHMVKLGRHCQAIVDHARVEWLRSVGWHAYVTRYTDASPENLCIVAQWKGVKGKEQAPAKLTS